MACKMRIAALVNRSIFALILLLPTLSGTGAFTAGAAFTEQARLSDRCPAYRVHLLKARDDLKRADRVGAVAELRQAREALRACVQDEQEGQVAVAALDIGGCPLGLQCQGSSL